MSWIIEFEGFNLSRGFVFKEVSILATDKSICRHFFLRPPCRFDRLTDKDKQIVRWCETDHHKIYWFAGKDKFSELRSYLASTLEDGSKIYTKGQQKVDILNLLGIPGLVENTENTSSLQAITQWLRVHADIVRKSPPCPLSFHKGNLHCAYIKAFVLAEEFNKSDDNESLFETESGVLETTVDMSEEETEFDH